MIDRLAVRSDQPARDAGGRADSQEGGVEGTKEGAAGRGNDTDNAAAESSNAHGGSPDWECARRHVPARTLSRVRSKGRHTGEAGGSTPES